MGNLSIDSIKETCACCSDWLSYCYVWDKKGGAISCFDDFFYSKGILILHEWLERKGRLIERNRWEEIQGDVIQKMDELTS